MKACVLWIFAVALVASVSVKAAKYRALVISTVEGGTFIARGLNNSNLLGGFVRSSAGEETGYIGNSSVAIRTGTLGGGSSWVNAVSNNKWSTGSSLDKDGVERAFLFWDNYMEDLSFFQPGGYGASAGMGIYEGQVTGWVIAPSGEKRAFLYAAGHFTVLPKFDVWSVGYASDGIRVAGVSMSEAGSERGFIWEDRFGPKYVPGAGSSSVYAMNNGRVVGDMEVGEGAKIAYMYDLFGQFLLRLGTLGGKNSKARAINSNWRMVGDAEDAQGRRRAFYFRKGTMFDLNDLIDGREPVILTSANAINDSDSILAEGSYAGQAAQFFLELTEPFDDPWQIDVKSARLIKDPGGIPMLAFSFSGPTMEQFRLEVSEDMQNWKDTIEWGYFYEWGNGTGMIWPDLALDKPKKFYRLRRIQE